MPWFMTVGTNMESSHALCRSTLGAVCTTRRHVEIPTDVALPFQLQLVLLELLRATFLCSCHFASLVGLRRSTARFGRFRLLRWRLRRCLGNMSWEWQYVQSDPRICCQPFELRVQCRDIIHWPERSRALLGKNCPQLFVGSNYLIQFDRRETSGHIFCQRLQKPLDPILMVGPV